MMRKAKPVANKLRMLTRVGPKKPMGVGQGMASGHPHKNLGKYLHKAKVKR